ncbi:hypothetical protein CL622_05990, partial [archaeon]|nr:hypothetical protein [archaeon]
MEESLNPQSIQEDQATSMVKTTKVLLMNPPFSLEKRYGKSIAKIGAVLLPLGLGYVAAVIERAGYPIKILDCEAENLDGEDVLQYCIKEKFDAIGVYCNTSNFNTTLTLCRQIKAALPGIKIITGGPQATNEKTATLQNDVFDFIVFGEAEETFVEILDSIEHKWDDNKKRSILGSGFKLHDTKEVIVNPSRPFIKDLDTLPFPARHLFKQDIYNPAPNQFKKLPYGSIMASRGCPYTCTFCNIVSIWKQEYRIRSPDNVISEMKHLKD